MREKADPKNFVRIRGGSSTSNQAACQSVELINKSERSTIHRMPMSIHSELHIRCGQLLL